MQRPTVRQLEYLVAVADLRHFGRAAKRCAVTQPALSTQIQQLEELLGVQVFERARRGVLVTQVGERVVARAREVLRDVDALLDEARSAREPLVGPLRMGVIPTVAPYVLPRALPAVRKAFPALELILREEQTDRLLAQLRDGALDLLLLALPVDEPDVETLELFREPFVVAVPEGHRFAGRTRGVGQDELSREDVLLLEDGHCLRDQALEVCREAGLRDAGGIQATSLGTLVQMVANGLGITLLPEMAVDVEVHPDGDIATCPFRAPVPGRTIGLVWRRASARGDEFRRLGALLGREAMRAARPRTTRDKRPRRRGHPRPRDRG